jgi:hypothetical protein
MSYNCPPFLSSVVQFKLYLNCFSRLVFQLIFQLATSQPLNKVEVMKFATYLLSFLILPLVSAFPFFTLSKRVTNLTSETQNDLVNGTPCLELTIIYARGTNSPGNVGDQPGPQLFQGLADKIGVANLAVQGVNYTATTLGYLSGGDKDGSNLTARLVEQAVSQCPNTKVSLGGYR